MGKRSLKSAAADVDELLDENEAFTPAPISDDELWGAPDEDAEDEDEGGVEGSEAEDAPPAVEGGAGEGFPPAVAVRDEFSAFVCSTLPAKMRGRPLADQANAWLLSAIGRACDEIRLAQAEGRRDDETIIDLELDLLKLYAAAEQRGLDETSLALETRVFIGGVAARIENAGIDVDEFTAPERDTEIAEGGETTGSLAIQYVPHALIHPDPLQPRVHADDELRDSIRANGILQPILVRKLRRGDALNDLVQRPEPCAHCGRSWGDIANYGEYVIVDGERRWRGADEVLEQLPVIVRADQVEEYARLKTQLVANTGKPLTPIEEARTYRRMLADRDVGIAGLARDLGKPASTINDRLKLLELGPWLPLIELGRVSVSMAVEHLVPLRGIPDAYHAQAIAAMEAHEGTADTPMSETIEEFGHAVARAYDKLMYPLTKTKNDYEKQPLFNTKAHDAECTCGGIKWGGSWQGIDPGGRRSCGNPDWWKPQHAAAKKAKENGEAPATGGSQKKLRLELPHGTPAMGSGYDTPKGVVALTDAEGRWRAGDRFGNDGRPFDPADLAIDEKKLVRVKSSYGIDKVGTKDAAAVEAARNKFAARFEPARKKAAQKLVAEFEKLEKEIYAVRGPGVHALLGSLEIPDLQYAEIAQLLEIEVPKEVAAEKPRFQRTAAPDNWFAKTITRKDAERLLSFIAFLRASEKRKLPSEVVAEDVAKTVEELNRKRAPWYTTKPPKTAAKNAGGGGNVKKRAWKVVQLDLVEAINENGD